MLRIRRSHTICCSPYNISHPHCLPDTGMISDHLFLLAMCITTRLPCYHHKRRKRKFEKSNLNLHDGSIVHYGRRYSKNGTEHDGNRDQPTSRRGQELPHLSRTIPIVHRTPCGRKRESSRTGRPSKMQPCLWEGGESVSTTANCFLSVLR